MRIQWSNSRIWGRLGGGSIASSGELISLTRRQRFIGLACREEQTQGLDTKTVNLLNAYMKAVDFHFIANRGSPAQSMEDQASHRDSLIGGKAKAKEFIPFVYPHTPRQLYATIWSLQYLWFYFTGFIGQPPQTLSQQVCQRNKPHHASVFVYDNGYLLAIFLELCKQFIYPDRLRHKGRLKLQRHQIQCFLIRPLAAIQCASTVVLTRNGCLQLLQFLRKFPVVQMLQILGVDDANNIIQ